MNTKPSFVTLRVSLQFSLATAFCGVVVLTSLFLGMALYSSMSHSIREAMRVRLHDALGVAATGFDASAENTLHGIQDEQTETYRNLVNRLRKVRDSMSDVRFVYTYRQAANGNLEYVLDAEENPQEKSHVGQVIRPQDITAKMRAALGLHRATPLVEEKLTSDQYGSWLSGYVPLISADGRDIGVLGMDISAKKVLQREHMFLWMLVGICGLITVLMIPVAIRVSRSVSRPLLRLAQEMQEIRQFDLDGDVQVQSRIVEINDMASALTSMKHGLRSFQKYVPADFVRKLISLGRDAHVGGDARKKLTIFFSDLAGFTETTDKMEPEDLTNLLNSYLSEMSEIADQYGGTLDKYIGDGIMIFFGDPESKGVREDALACVRMAVAMQQRLDELNSKWQSEGVNATLKLRIGIHTGYAAVGNFGSESRMNYTIVGGAVNLASRLEGQADVGGILISADTYNLVKDDIPCERRGEIKVKGISYPIETFRIVLV